MIRVGLGGACRAGAFRSVPGTASRAVVARGATRLGQSDWREHEEAWPVEQSRVDLKMARREGMASDGASRTDKSDRRGAERVQAWIELSDRRGLSRWPGGTRSDQARSRPVEWARGVLAGERSGQSNGAGGEGHERGWSSRTGVDRRNGPGELRPSVTGR